MTKWVALLAVVLLLALAVPASSSQSRTYEPTEYEAHVLFVTRGILARGGFITFPYAPVPGAFCVYGYSEE